MASGPFNQPQTAGIISIGSTMPAANHKSTVRRPDAISMLFRHTDGVPARIESALKDLELISISDLAATIR